MVALDHQLLYDARRLITGANVHRLKEMIFAYEQAVDLHNHDWPSHHEYQPRPEHELRMFVSHESLRNLDQKIIAARKNAQALARRERTTSRAKRRIDGQVRSLESRREFRSTPRPSFSANSRNLAVGGRVAHKKRTQRESDQTAGPVAARHLIK